MVNDSCVIGCCDNGKRYPDRIIIHSNIAGGKLVFHKIPINEERRKAMLFQKTERHLILLKISKCALTI